MSPATLFRRNLAVLRPFLGKAVIDILRTHKNRSVQVVGEPGTPSLNMEISSRPIYKPNATDYCKGQIRRFLDSPRQINLPDHLSCGENRSNLAAVIAAHISGMDYARYGRQPAHFDSVAALVSFGLGLGVHVEDLYAGLPCRDLIILEPEFEFFFASLNAVDWVPIVERVNGRKGAIYFLFEKDPRLAFDALSMFLRDRSYGLIEGSYLFDHYKHESFPAVVSRLYESGANLLSYNGWVEDEVTHVVNHTENAARNVRKLLTTSGSNEIDAGTAGRTAVVVGSGPSLNDTIRLIKNKRDKIILFSAGTSLGALLKAGLKPDFHCELENVDVVPDIIGNLKDRFDLSGITLVASTTVDPNVPALFDDCLFFLREGDGLLWALADPFEQIQLVGPSGVNTAVTIASTLGYQRIFLFGADFGVPFEGPKYASGVAYENIDKINVVRKKKGKSITAAGGSIQSSMNREISGNASDPVRSNDTLIGMLHRLEGTMRALNIDAYTVGNGAAIAGSKPCGEALFNELTGSLPTAGKPAQFRAVTVLEQGALFDAEKIAGIETDFEALFSSLATDVNALLNCGTPLTFEQVHDTFTKYMFFPLSGKGKAETAAIRAALTGSLMRILHMVRSHYARVPEMHADQFLRDALGIVQGMGLAWPEIVRQPILAKRMEMIGGDRIAETSFGTIMRGIRQYRTDFAWDIDSALVELQDREEWRYLARYMLKENIIRRLHNDRDWPAYDNSLVPLIEARLNDMDALDLFLFPALAYLSLDSDLPAKTGSLAAVRHMLEQRSGPGFHLLFYAGVYFLNAGAYSDARAFAERAYEMNTGDAGATRFLATVLLLNGELDKALDLYRSVAGQKIVLRIVSAVVDLEAVAVTVATGIDAGLDNCASQRESHPAPTMIACVEQVMRDVKSGCPGGDCEKTEASDLDRDYLTLVRRLVLDALKANP